MPPQTSVFPGASARGHRPRERSHAHGGGGGGGFARAFKLNESLVAGLEIAEVAGAVAVVRIYTAPDRHLHCRRCWRATRGDDRADELRVLGANLAGSPVARLSVWFRTRHGNEHSAGAGFDLTYRGHYRFSGDHAISVPFFVGHVGGQSCKF